MKKNNSKLVMKGKVSYPTENSPYLASRGELERGSVSYKDHPDALLAKRGDPEKGKVTYKEGRYN